MTKLDSALQGNVFASLVMTSEIAVVKKQYKNNTQELVVNMVEFQSLVEPKQKQLVKSSKGLMAMHRARKAQEEAEEEAEKKAAAKKLG